MDDRVQEDVKNAPEVEASETQTPQAPIENTELSKDSNPVDISLDAAKYQDETDKDIENLREKINVEEEINVTGPPQTENVETIEEKMKETKSPPAQDSEASRVDSGGNIIDAMEEVDNEDIHEKIEDVRKELLPEYSGDISEQLTAKADDNNDLNTEVNRDGLAMDFVQNDDTLSGTQENITADVTDDITEKHSRDIMQNDLIPQIDRESENVTDETEKGDKYETKEDTALDVPNREQADVVDAANEEEDNTIDTAVEENVNTADVNKENDVIIDSANNEKDNVVDSPTKHEENVIDINDDVNKDKIVEVTKEETANLTDDRDRQNDKEIDVTEMETSIVDGGEDNKEDYLTDNRDTEKQDITNDKDTTDDQIEEEQDTIGDRNKENKSTEDDHKEKGRVIDDKKNDDGEVEKEDEIDDIDGNMLVTDKNDESKDTTEKIVESMDMNVVADEDKAVDTERSKDTVEERGESMDVNIVEDDNKTEDAVGSKDTVEERGKSMDVNIVEDEDKTEDAAGSKDTVEERSESMDVNIVEDDDKTEDAVGSKDTVEERGESMDVNIVEDEDKIEDAVASKDTAEQRGESIDVNTVGDEDKTEDAVESKDTAEECAESKNVNIVEDEDKIEDAVASKDTAEQCRESMDVNTVGDEDKTEDAVESKDTAEECGESMNINIVEDEDKIEDTVASKDTAEECGESMKVNIIEDEDKTEGAVVSKDTTEEPGRNMNVNIVEDEDKTEGAVVSRDTAEERMNESMNVNIIEEEDKTEGAVASKDTTEERGGNMDVNIVEDEDKTEGAVVSRDTAEERGKSVNVNIVEDEDKTKDAVPSTDTAEKHGESMDINIVRDEDKTETVADSMETAEKSDESMVVNTVEDEDKTEDAVEGKDMGEKDDVSMDVKIVEDEDKTEGVVKSKDTAERHDKDMDVNIFEAASENKDTAAKSDESLVVNIVEGEDKTEDTRENKDAAEKNDESMVVNIAEDEDKTENAVESIDMGEENHESMEVEDEDKIEGVVKSKDTTEINDKGMDVNIVEDEDKAEDAAENKDTAAKKDESMVVNIAEDEDKTENAVESKDIGEKNDERMDVNIVEDEDKTEDAVKSKDAVERDVNIVEDEDKTEEAVERMDEDVAVNDETGNSTELPIAEIITSNEDDSRMSDENSIFVQVNNEKDDSDKCGNGSEQVTNEVDPIGSVDWSQATEPPDTSFISDLDEADECIIPDASKDDSISPPNTQESDSTLSSTPSIANSAEVNSMELREKYLVSVANTEEKLECMICYEKKVCKYNCIKDSDKSTLCSEECLTKLKEKHPENVIVRKLRVKNFSTDLRSSSDVDTDRISPSVMIIGSINCKNCDLLIPDVRNSLSWEAFDFCNEQCLTKHQKVIGSRCANCNIEVKEHFLGKYCVRFGYNVRQFCSSTCLEQYKKNSKVCSFCQDDISGSPSTLLTSIADRGMSKDFCSTQCMHNYNQISKHLKGTKMIDECCVCHKNSVIEIEFDFRNTINFFCGEPCFVAFKYVNEASPEKCDMCCKYFVSQPLVDNYLIRYDGVLRRFCQRTCQNIYVTTNRKIVSCCWCKVKKYNFDMIQKYTPNNTVLIICSLNCLNFFNASLNITKLKRRRCDYCHKICKGQYHITLADDSMKNFCSYPCVQGYQNKYIVAPARYPEQPSTSPATGSGRVTRKSAANSQERKQIIPDLPGPLPIITSVRSLAPSPQTMNTRSMRSKSSASTVATITTLQENTGPPPVRRIVLVRPPNLPIQRNMATLVKPITADAEVEFKPIMIDKSVQTEDIKDSLVLLPIPVPIYVPSPMQMFCLTTPRPVPFPLPIPIPIFMPVTKQTAGVVLKEMKKNQVRTPTDPYEADLLMMAEMVAVENEKKEPPESEIEEESGADVTTEPTFSPEPQDASTTFGDDMLQMALKMATDFEEPAVDLEGALTANTITATPGNATNESVDDTTPTPRPVERAAFRGRRRGRPPRHGGRGRGRGRPPTQPEIMPVESEPPPPPEPVEKPDADMCLKYTFGVNAWKQWVTTKNAELEKSSRRAKPFKPDLLQLTPDELNYSLCLFVKEVRKPNGAEYAPDTIYYLCLGIQQYLLENGRIDNIFCDSYYETFTDCLDEVCKKFSTLYNDSQYIVTRVEEEHLWESKQLGAHSPHVLLSTLMFFNTKHFNLTNVDEHMQLSFSHIMKHWKRVPYQPGTPKNAASRNILLRFYPPQSAVEGNNRKKKVYEQQENEENPLRCPVKLYEFYLSKCPESVKTRNDVFYLLPERSCVPDSPVWYSTMALGREPLEKMLHRVKMVKEINVALLAS